MLDLAVIGAGPCGLAVGVAAKRARLTCSLFDKGPVASSLMRYPLYMTFFSTPDKLEIGVPFGRGGVGARVTRVHCRREFGRAVTRATLPGATKCVKEGRGAVRWCGRVVPTARSHVVVRRDPDGDREPLPADFVLALRGYT